LDITRLIIIQVVAQVISSEMFLTAPALQITIVAAIILLIAPVAGVPVALEAQVRQEVVAEALHP